MSVISRKEWFDQIAQWEQSKQSQQAFCEANNIKLSTFGYYRKKYLESKSKVDQKKLSLLPLSISGNAISTTQIKHSADSIYIKSPRGLEIRCPANSIASIIALLRLVS